MKDYSKGKRPELLLILIHAAFVKEIPERIRMEGEGDS